LNFAKIFINIQQTFLKCSKNDPILKGHQNQVT